MIVRALRAIPPRPARTTEPEWMDSPGHDPAVIDDNLDDLRRVNRLLGGVRLTLIPLRRIAARVGARERLRVLDVATGAADIPRSVVKWGTRRPGGVFVVASDVSYDILAVARRKAPVPPDLVFVVADATRLPFADRAFHASTCSLALHHMLPDDAVRMLREMRRCASAGVVVNDVVRSWFSYVGAILATRVGSRNHLTLHDGPLSVRRAFTVSEMRQLAREAGLVPDVWDSFLFYRVAMTAEV